MKDVLIVLGLDGASLKGIAESSNRVRLPNFELVMKRGVATELTSIYPYVTAPAWSTIFAGVNPGKHGIFDQFRREGNTLRFPNMARCDVPFMWDYLTWAGKRTLVMGVPFVFPSPDIRGVFVNGRFSPKLSVSPAGIDTTVDLSGFEYDEDLFNKNFTQSILGQLPKRISASLELIDKGGWDAIIIVDSLPDEILHLAFHDASRESGLSVVDEMWTILDSWLGDILGKMGLDDTLLIISDHGVDYEEIRGVFYMNEWLRSAGLLSDSQDTTTKLASIITDTFAYRVLRRCFPTAEPYLKMRLGIGGPILRPRESRSKASSVRCAEEGLTWLKFNDSESEQVMQALQSRLGNAVKAGYFRRALRSKEVFYGGQAANALGQMLIEATAGWVFETERLHHGRITGRSLVRSRAAHRLHGMLISYGKSTINFSGIPSVLDVLPTSLEILGVPIPGNSDGRSLCSPDKKG